MPLAGTCCARRSGGTPARRRGIADTIAGELADMRGQTLAEYVEAHRGDASNLGDNDPPPPPPRIIDMRESIPAGHSARHAVDHGLRAAWSLAATAKHPAGSVRISTASPGRARLVRASGDGWTLIGRTDGPVILLLDELPGLPVDLDGTSQLRELLDGLTAAAERAGR